jgi:PAS domain S-box-containing protein
MEDIPAQEKIEQIYRFYRDSSDGIWCFELGEPVSIHKPLEDQVQAIIFHSKIIEANESFAKMYGYPNRDSVMGLPLEKILPLHIPEEWEHIRNFVRSGYSLLNEESQEIDKSGNFVYFLNSVQGIIENDTLTRIWGSQKDITVLKSSEQRLNRLLETERILGEISRTLIRLNLPKSNEIIHRCLEILGEFSGVDRAYIFEFENELEVMNNTYEWVRAGISQEIGNLQKVPTESVPMAMRTLFEKGLYRLDSIEDIPDLTEKELEVYNSQSIKSLLIVKIQQGSEILGFVGFDSVKNYQSWSEESIEMLKIVSDMLSIALSNIKYQRQLQEKEKSLLAFYDRINEDLEIAKVTQKNLVAWSFPASPYYRIASFFRPFEKVGGDVINYHLEPDFMELLFADVSGHGISAAMVSGMVVLAFQNSSRLKEDTGQCLSSMNRDLKMVVLNHHISAVVVKYFFREKKIYFAYAGHPPLAVLRKGKLIDLDGMNTPLLTIENAKYFESEYILESGDRLVFYSDGCFEVFNEKQEFLGLHPFWKILTKYHTIESAEEYIQKCIREVLEYCKDDIRDDLSMMVIDVI